MTFKDLEGVDADDINERCPKISLINYARIEDNDQVEGAMFVKNEWCLKFKAVDDDSCR